jgi:hypothetical protein
MQGAVHHVIDRVEFILCIVYIFIDDMTCYDYYPSDRIGSDSHKA